MCLIVRRTAVPRRKDGCGDAGRTEVQLTGLVPTPGSAVRQRRVPQPDWVLNT